MTLDAATLARLKVKDLQLELKKRGLDPSGLKTTLVQRLQDHLQQDESPGTQEPETKSIQTLETQEREAENETIEKESREDPVSEKEAENGEKSDDEKPVKRKAHDEEMTKEAKKPKLHQDTERSEVQRENEKKEEEKTMLSENEAAAGEKEEESTTQGEKMKTIRIDNFVRPFTLNAVKALVQEVGPFVENGFWMDGIKTHCFVTYSSPDIAEKTSAALDGKVWPPENGRSLSVKLVEYTAMEVSQYGEENVPSRPKRKASSDAPAPLRPNVTIDEFFHKTETKPVLYYLPLTDEQIQRKKERQGQKQEGPPRKRRHRGGRKRNRRNRFQRR